MKPVIKAFIGLLVASFLAGCQSTERRSPQRPISATASDLVHYSRDIPLWIFVPASNLTDDATGYPARVVVPNGRGYTTNRIKVTVLGHVITGGELSLSAGGTVFEAITRAGGFEPSAFTKRLHITKRTGKRITVALRSRFSADSRHREVWYQPYTPSADSSNKVAEDSGHDYVLEEGDRIYVMQTVY